MHKFLYLIILTLIAAAIYERSEAQTTTTPTVIALVCAYNSSPPAPTSGQFYLAQCNSAGQLLSVSR